LAQNYSKTSNERKKLAGRALPYAKLRLLNIFALEMISSRLAFAGTQEKRQEGRPEGRKVEKLQEVDISRVRRATSSGRIPTKLGKCVRLTDAIKRALFHNLRGFGAVSL